MFFLLDWRWLKKKSSGGNFLGGFVDIFWSGARLGRIGVSGFWREYGMRESLGIGDVKGFMRLRGWGGILIFRFYWYPGLKYRLKKKYESHTLLEPFSESKEEELQQTDIFVLI